MLDRSKPYAEVCGMPGAKFEQNGRLYRPDGSPVEDPNWPRLTPEATLIPTPVPVVEPGPADAVTVSGATENDRTGEMSRAEIMAELRRLKVKFAANKSTPVLQALLDAEREKGDQA